MPPSEKLEYHARAVHDLIAGTSTEQMDDATPCAAWDTRALITHLVGGATILGGAFRGEPITGGPDAAASDLLGDDPVAAWDEAIEAFREAVDAPGALEREVTSPLGAMPGSMLLDILTFDALVHAWDLARATGQPFDPPAEIVEPAFAAAQAMLAPQMRNGDTFAAEQTPPPGATEIERLAAFTGRTV